MAKRNSSSRNGSPEILKTYKMYIGGAFPRTESGRFYSPTVKRSQARASALDQLLSTFFDDSPAEVVTALLEARGAELTEADLDQLSQLIDRAREEGR